MRTIGSVVAALAYGEKIEPAAAQIIYESSDITRGALTALGMTAERIEELLGKAKTRYLSCLSLCESPIEQVMLAGLAFMYVQDSDSFPNAIHDIQSGDPWPDRPVVIAPQFNIARYRLDFLVHIQTASGIRQIAVECDGRQYHSNIQDRQNDADRDAYLAALGIKTIRYTGSWIYKNASRVADEISCIISEERKK